MDGVILNENGELRVYQLIIYAVYYLLTLSITYIRCPLPTYAVHYLLTLSITYLCCPLLTYAVHYFHQHLWGYAVDFMNDVAS